MRTMRTMRTMRAMRTMRTMRTIALAASLAALAGCAHSPPTRYYALEAIGPRVPPAAAPGGAMPAAPVQLTAVHIPAMLDRPEVVTRVAPNRLDVADDDRWAAPLAQMMRSVLAQDLLGRLPSGSFVLPDAPVPAGTHSLVVTVLALDADSNGRLSLQAGWSLSAPHATPSSSSSPHAVTLTAQGTGGGANDQAAALSRILAALADDIASALAREGAPRR
ncbi:membrane integrity-associated transporter subunit PqiC [Trinickia caryophylli]|nr:hypothetical protein C0Z17_14040 [Trinickia caryophylli]TRX20407.1 membrane integrity-associated transporter subunit PqiC [Trinickia caryophylli]